MLALLLCGRPGVALAADAPDAPPVVYFWAPASAPAEVAATRRALDTVAREQGGALIDLSPAPAAAPRAPALVAQAIDDYDALRFDAADKALADAAAEAATTGAAGLDPERLSDLLLYRALVATQRGADGWGDFVRAATVDPTRQLDPARFPPKTKDAFKRAADAVRAAPWGTIEVETPGGCEIRLDGRATATLQAPQGEHYLRVECAGFQPYGALVVLARDRQELAPELVRVEPPGAARVAEMAGGGGPQRAILATVAVSPDLPPVLRLQAVDPSGRVTGRSTVTLAAGGAATGDATAALRRIVQPAPAPVQVVIRDAPTPWYKRPWVWGVAGVVVTAAILVPLLTADGSGTLSVIPGGDLPPW